LSTIDGKETLFCLEIVANAQNFSDSGYFFGSFMWKKGNLYAILKMRSFGHPMNMLAN
jgi:hypothetical protein